MKDPRHVHTAACERGPVGARYRHDTAQAVAFRNVGIPRTGLAIGAPSSLDRAPKTMRDRVMDHVARFAADVAEGGGEAADRPTASSLYLPKPEDIVSVLIRLLSADVVPGWWMNHAWDGGAHLEAAVPMFDLIPVHSMHWADPTRWYGFMTDPVWDPTPLGKNGVPGINVVANIVGSANADARTIAIGIALQSLRRWSAGFQAVSRPSHPEMECCDFFGGLGMIDPSDGELVCFLVEEVTDAYEGSIVDVGAIESARTIDSAQDMRGLAQLVAAAPARKEPVPAAAGATTRTTRTTLRSLNTSRPPARAAARE